MQITEDCINVILNIDLNVIEEFHFFCILWTVL